MLTGLLEKNHPGHTYTLLPSLNLCSLTLQSWHPEREERFFLPGGYKAPSVTQTVAVSGY